MKGTDRTARTLPRLGKLAGRLASAVGPAEMFALGGAGTLVWGLGQAHAGPHREDALLVSLASAAGMWLAAYCLSVKGD